MPVNAGVKQMKKALAILLCAALLCGILPVSGLNTESDKTLKILSIGNSYSINATRLISRIGETMGIKVQATSLYKDGCTLKQHYDYMTGNKANYAVTTDDSPLQWGHTMQDVLESETYDIITFQQSPVGCDDFSTYDTEEHPYLTAIADYVRSKQPDATFMIHQTWAFCKECATGTYDGPETIYYPVNYPSTHDMFGVIRACYEKAAALLGGLEIIPVGEAIQLAFDDYGFDDALNLPKSLHKDTISHLNERGGYLAACVWIEKIFGRDSRTATFVPDSLTEEECVMLRKIAHETVTGETDTVIDGLRVLPNGDGYKLMRDTRPVPANGVISVPATVGGKAINAIGVNAFRYKGLIRKIILPQDATEWAVDEGALTLASSIEETVNTMSFDTAYENNEGNYFISWWSVYGQPGGIAQRNETGNWLVEPNTGGHRGNATVFYNHRNGASWDADSQYINFGDIDHTGNGGHSIFVKNSYSKSTGQFAHSFLKVSRLFGDATTKFNDTDLGRTFKISFWVYVEQTPSGNAAVLEYGMCPIAARDCEGGVGGGYYGKYYKVSAPIGQWKQVEFTVTLDETHVGPNQVGLLGIYDYGGGSPAGDGSDALTYYLDDITVTEVGQVTTKVQYGQYPTDQTLKILSIGNSYSINATRLISRIGETMGIKVQATSLYKDGCTLKQHYDYMTGNKANYAVTTDDSPLQWGHTMQDVLESETYDIITFQQSPVGCDDFSTYDTEEHPYLTAIADYVRSKQPDATFMIHQTWAFCKECATGTYDGPETIYYPVNYPSTHDMFGVIRACYEKAAALLGGLEIIPVGEAIQLAFDDYGFDDALNLPKSLHKDTISHLNERGGYLAACVWIEKIFGRDSRTATFVPDSLTEEECVMLRKIAHETVTGETDTVYGDFRVLPNETGCTLTRFVGKVPADGKIEIPETIGGMTVTAIASGAFARLKGIREISVSKAVTNVEEGALDIAETTATLVNKMSFDTAYENNQGAYFINWWTYFQGDASIHKRTENGNWLVYPSTDPNNQTTVFYSHVNENSWADTAEYIDFGQQDHTGNGGYSIRQKACYNGSSFNNSFLKVSRLFGDEKKTFTQEDLGRKLTISFWIYVESSPNNSSVYLEYGLCPIGTRNDPDGYGFGYYGTVGKVSAPVGEWKQVSLDVTLDEKHIGMNQIGLLGIYLYGGSSPAGDGSDATIYYLDDIEVNETKDVKAAVTWRETVPGDCDGDGEIDTVDLTLLKKKLAGLFEGALSNGADFDKNGKLDTTDLVMLKKKLAGLI